MKNQDGHWVDQGVLVSLGRNNEDNRNNPKYTGVPDISSKFGSPSIYYCSCMTEIFVECIGEQ